jgi:UDP-glucose 4-epimerase
MELTPALADNQGRHPADATFLQKGARLHHVNDCWGALSVAVLQLVKGDIQSMDLLSFVLQAEEIDTIMHFAAQVG